MSSVPLTWADQKAKETAVTPAMKQALKRLFGPEVLVRTLGQAEQHKGDFELRFPSGLVIYIEAKVEDYPGTWFLEVLQLLPRASGSATLGRIEKGWAYTSTASFLLYLSSVTEEAVFAARAPLLKIQVDALQLCMLASRHANVPLLLHAALNERNGVFCRAGVGMPLEKQLILERYTALYGQGGLAYLDMRPELEQLKRDFQSSSSWLVRWSQTKLLSKAPADEPVEGSAAPDPAALHRLAHSPISANSLENTGLRFFQAAAVAGLVTSASQMHIAPAVEQPYRKVAGTSHPGNDLANVKAPLSAALNHPGDYFKGSRLKLQTWVFENFAVSERELLPEGRQERREAYLRAVIRRYDEPSSRGHRLS